MNTKKTWILAFGLVLIGTAVLFHGADASTSLGTSQYTPRARVAPASVTFLPPEVSRDLDITTIPRPEPEPLIVGHYWSCSIEGSTGFEICDIVLVVCEDDQSFCIEL